MANKRSAWSDALRMAGGNMEAAREILAAKSASSKSYRTKISAVQKGATGIAGEIGAAAGTVATAYYDAQARIEEARQEKDAKTNVASLEANQPIMHELDRPFITLTKSNKTGGTKLSLSVLSLYMLGVILEKANNSMRDVEKGQAAAHLTADMLLIRAPLIATRPTEKTYEETEAGGAIKTAAAQNIVDVIKREYNLRR